MLTISMNLHNLLNSTTEFEHIKAQYFTVFGRHLYFWGINLALSRINSVNSKNNETRLPTLYPNTNYKLYSLDLYFATD
jgi:hypothetical protein